MTVLLPGEIIAQHEGFAHKSLIVSTACIATRNAAAIVPQAPRTRVESTGSPDMSRKM
jgi:hypothetical protein